MMELVWQKTEIILAILAAVAICTVVVGSLVFAVILALDVLKPRTKSGVTRYKNFSTITPIMHKRGHVPRKHKPGHRRSASMDTSSLDSVCPGGCDE